MSRPVPVVIGLAVLLTSAACSRKPAAPAGQPAASSQPGAAVQPGAAPQPGGGAAPVGQPVPAPPPRQAVFEAGARLVVRTTSVIDTRSARDGDRWEGSLEKPLQSGDWTVAPKGSTVSGVVVNSDPGGRVKGRASLVLAVTGLRLPDGRSVELNTLRVTRIAPGTVKKDTIRTGIASGLGAAIGAIAGGGKGAAIGAGAGAAGGAGVALATRGAPASVPAESVLNFTLAAPLTITARK